MEITCEIVTEYGDMKETVRVSAVHADTSVEAGSLALVAAARYAVDELKERRTLIL